MQKRDSHKSVKGEEEGGKERERERERGRDRERETHAKLNSKFKI